MNTIPIFYCPPFATLRTETAIQFPQLIGVSPQFIPILGKLRSDLDNMTGNMTNP